MIKVFLVVPCYNEEDVLPETSKRLRTKFHALISSGAISDSSRIVFVNDGSGDSTWDIISRLHTDDTLFGGVNLSRNRGHQNALLSGLMSVKDLADCVISMDADLQDDIDAIDGMLEAYARGCDIVYGVRSSRKKDSFFKRFTAEAFYNLMKWLGVEIVFNHADYRLMSRRALDALADFGEVNMFLRGIVPLIGFKSDVVYYERKERFAGESKYPLKKMLRFAFEGITSFSVKPIRMILSLGGIMSVVSLLMLAYSIYSYMHGTIVPGWTSLIFSVWAIGGIQMIAIGVIGEYIGKIYLETKHRPKYIVQDFIIHSDSKK